MKNRIRFNVPANLLHARKLIGILLIFSMAIIFGAIAALFQTSFTIQLMMLVIGVLVLLTAKLTPSSSKIPFTLMRRLLYTLIVVWIIWPEYLVYAGLPGPGITPTRLIYWSLAGLWIYWFIISTDLRKLFVERINLIKPFWNILIIYLVWAFICALASEAPLFSIHYLIKLMIGPLLIFAFSLSFLREREDLDFVFFLLTIATLIACIFGYVEIAKGKNLFYGLVPNLVTADDSQALKLGDTIENSKLISTGSFRIWSTFTNPLTFSEYLVLSFPLSIFLVGYSNNILWRVISFATIPAALGILLYSQARSSLIATGIVIASLVVTLGIRAMRQKRSFGISIAGAFSILILCFTIVGSAGLASEMIFGRNSAETSSSFARVMMLKHGSELTMNSPLWGYGPGLGAVTLGFLPGFKTLTIDSYYLSAALETGVPGLLLFIGLLGYPIYQGINSSLKANDKNAARIVVIYSSLIGFFVIRSVLSLTNNFGIVFLLISLLVIAIESENKNSDYALRS